ncbi:MAG TPA: imelysin family protein [Actinomycetota bacterium]|nr:imelysin family protein [Actinomycetota bacterium]
MTLTACTANPTTTDGSAIPVSSTADACKVGSTEVPSGTVTFRVTNDGDDVTEFYLLGEDGLRIIGEVENIGPGLSRDLVVLAAPGQYQTACKPGMVGDGIRAPFTVTDSGADLTPDGPLAEQVAAATASYAAYVRDQTEQLVAATEEFAAAYVAGDDERARALYAATRMHWERIEPVAESFGDLDPRLDLREADLEPGQQWTGWHRIEKDLWPPADGYEPMSQKQREKYAALLVADTAVLYKRTRDMTFTADQLGNGAKELLDEVATGKVTGEEEIWSHTDLWDFQANVDGAKVMYDALRPVVQELDPELAEELDTRFQELQDLLDKYRDGDGFVYYDQLSKQQVKELSAAVDALGEPLSRLTSVVVTGA